MEWMRAADTFTADLSDGTQVRVVKGDPFPDDHELVRRDADAAKAAAKAGTERAPLFRPIDETAAASPSKGRAGRRAS